MRIAYVCMDLGVPVFGGKGPSVHVQEVLRALLNAGAQSTLFAARLDGTPPADLRAVRTHQVPVARGDDQRSREQAARAANDNLRDVLARHGPFDLVYERYSLWSFAGMEHARAAGIPGLLEVHAPLVDEQAAYRALVDREGAEQVARTVFSTAAACIAVSEEIAAYLQQCGVPPRRIHVIANGVNPHRFAPGVPAALPAMGIFTAGFVGSLKPWHGVPVLLEAFAALHRRDPKTRLLIVGDGPQRQQLEEAAHTLRDAVHFTGAVSPDAVPGLLASMDTAVAPYPPLANFYFSPLKVFEYMASGLPTVASRLGQLQTVIQDGINGLLCPPGDPRALEQALERLLNDPPLRSRLGREARASVLARHTWEIVARRILDVAEVTRALQLKAASS